MCIMYLPNCAPGYTENVYRSCVPLYRYITHLLEQCTLYMYRICLWNCVPFIHTECTYRSRVSGIRTEFIHEACVPGICTEWTNRMKL